MKGIYSILVTFNLVLILPNCKGQHANTCNVGPKDQYIEVGSDTEVWCQTSCIHGKIFWTLNNRPIAESLSNTVNSSHTVLSLRNFTHHSATLLCHSAYTQQVIGGTAISTYSKPRKISCILHYKNQALDGVPQLFTCNWEHQTDSSLKINYTVLISSSSSSSHVSQSEICYSHVNTCTHYDIGASRKIQLPLTYSVIVRAKTAAWEVYSDPYEFYPFDILKIIPPDLNITIFSDHLLVKWTQSLHPTKCQVKYRKTHNDSSSEKVLNTTLHDKKNGNLVIGVESCTNYSVSGRCALDKAPWSDWSQEKTVLTKLKKSDIRLYLWRKVAEQHINAVRKVHVMWKEIPSTCQGTFTYTIKKVPFQEQMNGVNYTDTLCSSSTCVVDVNQDAHRINLSVFHNETLLATDSVYVPAIEESLPQVTEIQISAAKGVIEAVWKAPVQPVRGYMIDWTHDGNKYYWKESKYTNTTLCDLEKKPYNITVTPLFDDKTGHGTQALEICSRVGGPGNVTIDSVQAYNKKAYVSWRTRSQEECSGAVINYTIFYSTAKVPLNVTIDGKKQEILLKDLNPDTQYSVYIKATALSGTAESSERHFKTKQFDPRLVTALSVFGSIIIILVFSLGLCCTIQWKRFREKPVPNPGLSSLALWPSPGHLKGMCSFQAFSNPSESFCDRVYMEETQRTATPPRARDPTEENTDPAIVLAPDPQIKKPVELFETQHLDSVGEAMTLLPSENNIFNPYRCQSSVETSALRTNKPCNHVPVKQQEKPAQMAVYVTLNMLQQCPG